MHTFRNVDHLNSLIRINHTLWLTNKYISTCKRQRSCRSQGKNWLD